MNRRFKTITFAVSAMMLFLAVPALAVNVYPRTAAPSTAGFSGLFTVYDAYTTENSLFQVSIGLDHDGGHDLNAIASDASLLMDPGVLRIGLCYGVADNIELGAQLPLRDGTGSSVFDFTGEQSLGLKINLLNDVTTAMALVLNLYNASGFGLNLQAALTMVKGAEITFAFGSGFVNIAVKTGALIFEFPINTSGSGSGVDANFGIRTFSTKSSFGLALQLDNTLHTMYPLLLMHYTL